MTIRLAPPPGFAPFRKVPLSSGAVALPDADGFVEVEDSDDAIELLAEGWRLVTERTPIEYGRAAGGDMDLRKNAEVALVKRANDLFKTLGEIKARLARIEAQPVSVYPSATAQPSQAFGERADELMAGIGRGLR